MKVAKEKKVKAGKVTAQGMLVPTKEDIEAGKIEPRGRNRGRGR
jgi:ribosomal protein S30